MKSRKIRYFVGVLVLVGASLSFGQQKKSDDRNSTDERSKPTEPVVPVNLRPLEAPLDPNTYQIGAGDQFTIHIGSIPPIVFSLAVGVDGRLLIPSVGELNTYGLTLSSALDRIKDLVGQRYLHTPVFVSLAKARTVLVHVKGNPRTEPTYIGPASNRVSTVIEGHTSIARRSIFLRRSDGSRHRIDLDKFMATGDSQWNPHLSEGDEIVFSEFDNRTPTVAVGGAVVVPGEFEFIEGDRVIDLLEIARGARLDARVDSVILYSRKNATHILNISGPDSLVALQAGDRLLVPSERVIFQAHVVSVTGEVGKPGFYPIMKGTTRLSEIIAMAGGMTEGALVHGATLRRAKGDPLLASEVFLLSTRGNAIEEDTSYVRQEAELRLLGERVNVDFRLAVQHPGSSEDPVLLPDDRIMVPRKTGTVYVFGQVTSPGHLPYIHGASYGDYIENAGGYTDNANSSDAMVIKSGTGQWLEPDETSVEEGDALWIPKELQRPFAQDFQLYAQLAGVFSALATVILVISQLSK